jgi:hypothetical protein
MDIQDKVIKGRNFDGRHITGLTRVTFTGEQASFSAIHCNEIKITDSRAPAMSSLGLDSKTSWLQIDNL